MGTVKEQPPGAWSWIRPALGLICVVSIFGYMVYRLRKDWAVIVQIDWSASAGLLFLHLFLIFATFFFQVGGWIFSLYIHGYPVKILAGARSYLIPNLGKYVPGKVLMVAGRIEFSKRLGVKRAASVSAMTVEHLILLMATLPFLPLAFPQGSHYTSYLWRGVFGLIFVTGLVVVAMPRIFSRAVNGLLGLFRQPPLELSIKSSQLFMLLLLDLVYWLVYGISGVVLARAVGLGSPPAAHLIASAFVASWLIGFLSFLTPGGLGIREGTLALLLAPYGQTPTVLVLAIVARLTWVFTEQVLAACALLLIDVAPRTD